MPVRSSDAATRDRNGFVSVSMAPAGRDTACEDPHPDGGVRPSTTRSRLGGCCSSRPASAASRRVVVWVRRASRRGFCKRLWRVSSASTQACNASDIMKHRYPAVLATEVRPHRISDCRSVGVYQRAVTRPCRLCSGSPWPSKLWRRWASRPNSKFMAPACNRVSL